MVLAISGLLVNGQMDTTHNKMKMQQITIKVTDLPKGVTENIAKDYPGYNITEAYTGMMSEGVRTLKRTSDARGLIYPDTPGLSMCLLDYPSHLATK
jgi:hypothetical protein